MALVLAQQATDAASEDAKVRGRGQHPVVSTPLEPPL
jgi:hypothetical protein